MSLFTPDISAESNESVEVVAAHLLSPSNRASVSAVNKAAECSLQERGIRTINADTTAALSGGGGLPEILCKLTSQLVSGGL